MIIGISGYIGSGKDTVGAIIQYLDDNSDMNFEDWYASNAYSIYNQLNKGWEIKKFAEKLKQIASMLTGIPREKFEDQEFKKTFLSHEWQYLVPKPGKRQDGLFGTGEKEIKQMTVREFLQKLGTEGIRTGVHTNAWVNALFADYQSIGGTLDVRRSRVEYPNWIVTDCRYPNEAQVVKDKGGIVIRVNRHVVKSDYMEKAALHPSETSLDTWKFDYTINNNGTIDELVGKVKVVMEEFVGAQINIKN